MGKQGRKSILTICHDAGGAEVISSFIRKNQKKYRLFCFTEGPAKKVFERKGLGSMVAGENPDITGIMERTGRIDLVLTGTSWATSLEIDFIREARRKKIKTAAYLDHWTNYRERFGYPKNDWKNNLPDEIWVGDKYALALAKKKFAGRRIKLVPNVFLGEIRRDWCKIKKSALEEKTILFVSEPIDGMKNKGESSVEIVILGKLLKLLVKNFPEIKVVIRLHPSERINKYERIMNKYGRALKISVEANQTMFESLARCSAVIGMKSMFLVVSVLCGKKTASFLPEKNLHCLLPDSRIAKIKNLEQLNNWFKINFN